MRHGKYRFVAGFLALPVAIYAIFVISPFVQAFQISLTDWSGITPDADFTGLRNFRRLVHDQLFWRSLEHNVVMLLVLPTITLSLGLFFAFMLNVGGRRRRGAVVTGVRAASFYRIVFFFPQVLSIAVIAVLWQNVYNSQNGLLTSALGELGVDAPAWLGDPGWALPCVMAVMVWSNVGFYVVLFSAAMASVPRELYEAALLDGAGRGSTFFRITLPLLWDTVQTGWVYMGIIALDGFAIMQIMTDGGPDDSTDVVSLLLYNTAFRDSHYGYASALGVAMLVVTLVFAALTMRLGRRERIEY